MSNLVQIIYISRSTSPVSAGGDVDPVVARILAKSRANNRRNGLVGVLYFGDGCFFQCLEGEEAAVDALYATLEKDPRHCDLKVISRKPIAVASFQSWSMKYVPIERDMSSLLRSRGMEFFDPYRFDAALTHDIIKLLHAASAPDAAAAPAPAAARAAPTPARVERQEPAGSGGNKLAVPVAALIGMAAGAGLMAMFG